MQINIRRGDEWARFALSSSRLTLLEALYQCKGQEPSLRFRSSCGAGMCGTCAVVCDGKPVLACKTTLEDGEHWVEPLCGFEVIQDLEVDKKRLWDEEMQLSGLMPQMIENGRWDFMESTQIRVNPMMLCLRCGICVSACTTTDLDWGARTRMKTASHVIDTINQHTLPLPPSESQKKLRGVYGDFRAIPEGDALDTLYRHMLLCSACGRCEEFCPMGIQNKVQVLELAKERLYQHGAKPVHTKLISYYPFGNSYGEPPENRLAWLPADVKLSDNPEVALFIGCTASYRRTESALALVKILQWLDIPFAIPTGERCCGSSFIRAGVGKRAKTEFMAHNVELLAETKAKRVLTTCAGCARTWRKDYPIYQGHMPFRVEHVLEYLAERIDGGLKLPYVGGKATYHDSCHLGRGMGVYEAPRKVMRAMGIEIIEMDYNSNNSHCCGGGGGMRSGFHDLSLQIAGKRLREAEATRTERILTGCVFCSTNLGDAIKSANSGMRVLNIEVMLADAIQSQS